MLKFVTIAASLAVASAPATMVEEVSSPLNDYNPSLDARERTMVFARSEADFRNARIFVTRRAGTKWAEPAPISFTDPRFSDSDPWLTPDGRTLYFVSDRPTATRPDKKDLDIWRSRLGRGGWSQPEHLGDSVNSAGPELGPEVHGGALYFSSARRGGKGGLDIYSAQASGSGFEAAQVLAGPFNSAESDSDFTVSADGRLAAFWRGTQTSRIFLSRRGPAGWTEPQPLPASINLGPFNFTPCFSRDAKQLWLASTAPRAGQEEGMADIYRAGLDRLRCGISAECPPQR